MAHPRPRSVRSAAERLSLTVVVPVRDRPDLLDRCLASLGSEVPVVVVDDASRRPDRVAAVCRDHGAQLLRREANGGPAAARNTALDRIDTDLVAFVDSDCTVGPGWLEGLAWQFADPVLAAVAPRIRPEPTEGPGRPSVLARFTDRHSALDLGAAEGEVGPTRAVRYVPTAALVARRCALAGGFDEGLRVGEDVDLVWRLLDAGWHVRYAPSVTVAHREPTSWRGTLARRVRYGTSAAPLARRHPGRLAPVELRAWPTAAAVSLLAGRPRLAALIVAGSALSLARTVRPLGIPGLARAPLERGRHGLDGDRPRSRLDHARRAGPDRALHAPTGGALCGGARPSPGRRRLGPPTTRPRHPALGSRLTRRRHGLWGGRLARLPALGFVRPARPGARPYPGGRAETADE